MGDLRPQVWTSHAKSHGSNISYAQALRCLAGVAVKQKSLSKCMSAGDCVKQPPETSWSQDSNGGIKEISVLSACNRICAYDVRSPCSTPATDTSAMDGFAVESVLTANASAEYPVKFRVAGIIAAGADIHDNKSLGIEDKSLESSDRLCVEIMTGAPFPERQFPQLDAVVKVEDVELVEDLTPNRDSVIKYILVSGPVKGRQHRRPAGTDFCHGDLVIAKGTKIQPKHVMALTSVGIDNISVEGDSVCEARPNASEEDNTLTIGVLPTGSELLNIFDPASKSLRGDESKQRFPDSNGPYLTSAIRSMSPSLKVDYIGPCPDDEHSLSEALSKAVEVQQYDLLVTSGGVSMGRFDLVRKALETCLDAEIIFHGCLVRPGAPVLFGVMGQRPDSRLQKHGKMTAFIGAPGNPIAAAMTVRFFLKPFLRMLQAPQSLSIEDLVQMVLLESSAVRVSISNQEKERRKPTKAVAFLLANSRRLRDTDSEATQTVDLLEDQASYKIKPFSQADCWITAPAGKDRISDGDYSQAYSLW